jgi:hypothetical protein
MRKEDGMTRTINLTAEVPPDREVRLLLPKDVPTGPAEFTIVVTSHANLPLKTLEDFAKSEFFGMWRDRRDIQDSVEFARELRERAWSRHG